ncbi:muscle M-line assembly protein unc-89-like isoform X2 [Lineus longissimus]|uniref:muscle M-line assembly protein unc-89-like isoform X2 n=1 Tax=Lineus longissimus TaxID=88925 RepID=UPI00315C7C81
MLMSGFKFFSPLRTPHMKNTKGESHDRINKPDKELERKNMGQTENKKHDSSPKSKSKEKLDLDRKSTKRVKGGTTENLPRKTSESDDGSGSDTSRVPTSDEEIEGSETESQIDRSLSQFADNLRARLHYHSESENDSEIIPIMNSPKLRQSPRKKGSGSVSNPNSPSKKMRSPCSPTKAISPKKKLREVKKLEHELSESAESAESGGEEVHYKVPKLRNPPPADYVPVDFNEYKPLISAEETKSDDVELILITVPFGFDINDLDNKPLQMDGAGLIKKDKDGVSWKSHARKLTKDDKIHEYMPLLPSKRTGQLVPVKPFSRQVTFTASYEIPALQAPAIPPDPSFEIPEGLKYRNKPFGCLEEDDKLESPKKDTKRSPLKKKTQLDKTLSPDHGKKRRLESAQQHNDMEKKKRRSEKKSKK